MSLATTIQSLKNEEYMSEVQIKAFKVTLEEARTVALEKREKAKSSLAGLDRIASEAADLANIQTENEDLHREIEGCEIDLRKINKALEQMRLGEYGYCEDCGTEIGLERLGVAPSSTRDMDCQTKYELLQRQNLGRNIRL